MLQQHSPRGFRELVRRKIELSLCWDGSSSKGNIGGTICKHLIFLSCHSSLADVVTFHFTYLFVVCKEQKQRSRVIILPKSIIRNIKDDELIETTIRG